MRLRRLLWLVPAVALLAATTAAWWLLATEAGLAWAWGRTVTALDGRLSAERVSGRLLGPVRVEGLRLEQGGTRLAVDTLALDWQPGWLLAGRVALRGVTARGVRVTLAEAGAGAGGGAFPGRLVLPLAVSVEAAVLHDLRLARPGEVSLAADEVRLDGSWRGARLRLASLSASGPWGRITLEGHLATGPGWTSKLAAQWALTLAGQPVAGQGQVGGSFAEPLIEVRLSTPFVLRGKGRLAWQASPLRWQAEFELPPLLLSAVQPQWPALTLGAHGRLEGVGAGFMLEATGVAEEARAGRWDYAGQLAFGSAGWRLDRLQLHPRQGSGELLLSGAWAGAQAAARLDAQWRDFSHPVLPDWRSNGSLGVVGLPGEYGGQLSLDATRSDLPSLQVSADFAGSLDGIKITALEGRWLEGQWRGEAALDWRKGLDWRARLGVGKADPGQLDARWPGVLDGTAEASGSLRAGHLSAELTQLQLQGRLAGRPVQLDAAATLDQRQLTVRRLELSSGSSHFSARGGAGTVWGLRWQLEAAGLAELWPEAAGRLSLKGRVDGPEREPRLRLDGAGTALAWAGTSLEGAQLHADIDLAGAEPWVLDLQLQGMARAGQRLETARLRADGSAARHDVTFAAHLPGGTELAAAARGSWAERRWQGELRSGRLQLAQAGIWRADPAALTWGPDGGTLQPWCWRGQGDACIGIEAAAGQWQATGALAALPLALLEPWLPRSGLALGGTIGGAVSATGTQGAVTRLTARLGTGDGRLRYRLQDGAVESALRTLRLDVDGDAQGLVAQLQAELDHGGAASARLALPGWMPGQALADTQTLEGRLDLETGRLEWLTYLEPNLLRPEGQLQMHLQLAGTLTDPALSGELALREGSVMLPAAGTRLTGIRLTGRSIDGRTLTLNGAARSGPGELSVSGQLSAERFGRWRAELALKGERFELVRLVQAQVLVSPDIKVVLEQGRVEVSGQFSVPQADINLPRLPTVVEVSPDEVILDPAEEAAALQRWRLLLNLRLVAGERVRLEGYGFSGRLAGAVTLRGETPGLTRAQGELNIHDGRYEAYGQNLVVERGRLLFVDSPPDNPGLDVRAVRPLPDPEQTVGVEVSGRLKDPRLRLFSVPVLEESEALAWLVLGRPLASTSRTEADTLYRAAFALGGDRAARGIALQFGLDEVSLEQGRTGDEAAVVLGKYLSPRLYLQYAVGLWETANRWRLRYQLSSHWSLKMEQGGEQSGADLQYVIER